MLKDYNHDLVKQLSITSSGLWRIKKEYKKNAAGCGRCKKLWSDVERKLEEVSALLIKEITSHIKEGKFK